MYSEEFELRQIAAFDKPGLHSRLALYEVLQPSTRNANP
jgi:hypothetical protein